MYGDMYVCICPEACIAIQMHIQQLLFVYRSNVMHIVIITPNTVVTPVLYWT